MKNARPGVMNMTSADATSIHAVSPALTDETAPTSPCAHAPPVIPRNTTDMSNHSFPPRTMENPPQKVGFMKPIRTPVV